MRVCRMSIMAVVALLAITALAAPAAQAWVRHESDRWVWYTPNSRWVDAQSDNGIDISSPTGALYVGHGFGPTPSPVTHSWVVNYVKTSKALDLHPLRRVRIGKGRSAGGGDGIERRVYKWSGYRTDRREGVRGVVTVDVINDPSTFSYGFAMYSRVAPRSLVGRWNRRLTFIQKQIRLIPRSPDFSNAFP
jgi:hypothetical protein